MFWPNETSLSEILLRGFSKLSLLRPPACISGFAWALFGNADFSLLISISLTAEAANWPHSKIQRANVTAKM